VKHIESNENSGNAAVKHTMSKDHNMNTDRDGEGGAGSGGPSHTLNRIVTDEDGTVIKEETKSSSEKSSGAPTKNVDNTGVNVESN
jgi:hypothetical protein